MRRGFAGRRADGWPEAITIVVDGATIETLEGRSLASVLHAAGMVASRRNPVTGEERGAFCGMGVCFECEVTVDGRGDVRACMTDVREGLVVTTGLGRDRQSR